MKVFVLSSIDFIAGVFADELAVREFMIECGQKSNLTTFEMLADMLFTLDEYTVIESRVSKINNLLK